MLEKLLNQSICLKEYISEKEYKEIKELEEICASEDHVNLKLEVDYKLSINKNSKVGLKNVNEFLYYIDEKLVAYLGIASFGGNIGELNGVVHPKWRRKGIFKKLFKFVLDECKKRNFNEILLLTDDNSNSGAEFIKAMGGTYKFTEYRMKRLNKAIPISGSFVNLRKAERSDENDIRRQNDIYFHGGEEVENLQEADIKESEISISEEESLNEFTYMIELEKEVIGKIKIDYSDNSAFICGFGVLPGFRGKGYGKAALMEALCLIGEKNINDVELDVEGKNDTALNLYKSCGFEKQSAMNYYRFLI